VAGLICGTVLTLFMHGRELGRKIPLWTALGFAGFGLWISTSWSILPHAITSVRYLPVALIGAIGGAILGLCIAWVLADSRDEEFLSAAPIPKLKMLLLWLNESILSKIRTALAGQQTVAVYMGDDAEQRDWDVSRADLGWVDGVIPVATKAYETGGKGNYYHSIQFFKRALKLAPGCDLYLMSIGSAYVNIGQVNRGIQYLKRAAEISPGNSRIQENLAKALGH
jgi:hypothetical protein